MFSTADRFQPLMHAIYCELAALIDCNIYLRPNILQALNFFDGTVTSDLLISATTLPTDLQLISINPQ